MTRINLVDPKMLTDKHLLAEYRELPRIFTAVKKLYASGKTLDDVEIPDKYVLGKGHCKFFYNKLYWLHVRYSELIAELKKRSFKLDSKLHTSIIDMMFDVKFCSKLLQIKYQPTPEEMYLNTARLAKRSNIEEVLNELNFERACM